MKSELDGNAGLQHITGDISPIESKKPSAMSWTLTNEHSQSQSTSYPTTFNSPHSSSLPSTPYHRPCDGSVTSRSPSPNRLRSTSPRSIHSETTHTLPFYRRHPPQGWCQYETAMAHFRRRMPYSLGGDLLPKATEPIREKLSAEEQEKLTGDMCQLYEKLLPSKESDERRAQFARKLEGMLNRRWPGNDIRVHVFGSSGNKLCSSDSDSMSRPLANRSEFETKALHS